MSSMMKMMLPKLMLKWEKWKWNDEYGIYVSNTGRFRDKDKQNIPIKIIESSGYVFVRTKHGARPAHRLVMLTWKPIPDRENFSVDHLDHNKRNNAVENLEWVTAYENIERAKADIIKTKEVTLIEAQVICAVHKTSNTEKTFQNIDEAVNFIWDLHKQTAKAQIKQGISSALNKCGEYKDYKWKFI